MARIYPKSKNIIIYTVILIFLNLAHHFKFHYWIFELIYSVFPQLLITSIIWGFLLVHLKRHKQCILLFVIIALQFLHVFRQPQALALEPNTSKNTFKVMSTNILMSNFNIEKIINDIIQSDAETISILELTIEHWLKIKDHPKIIEQFPYMLKKTHPLPQFGIAVISKYPFVFKNWMFSTKDRIPSIKVTQLTKIGLVDAVFTHAHSPLGPDGYEQRNIHLNKIARLTHSHKRPYFIIGDINMTRWSPWFQEFIETSKLRFSQTNDFWNHTWYIFPYIPLGIHIDHFFYNDKIRVVHSRIGPYTGSDHRSLTITMKANK